MPATIDRIRDTCIQLEPVELELVALFADRLLLGQRQYGRYDPRSDRRDYLREASEELVDAAVYGLMATMRARTREPVPYTDHGWSCP